MVGHSDSELISEDPARNLNNQISELQARVAFPHHWSSGEHQLNLEKLRQLQIEKHRLISSLEQLSPVQYHH